MGNADYEARRATINCCPTCGGKIDIDELIVDLNTNTLMGKGCAVLVPPRHAELAYVLQKRFPATVRHETIIAQIWGDAEISDHLLSATLCMTRRYLERVGWGIKNESGQGYRLVKR